MLRSRQDWRGSRIYWILVGAYAGLVAYLSLRPVGQSDFDRAIDSVGRGYFHLPAYAGLAVLLALAPSRLNVVRRACRAFVLATAYGGLLELAQIPAPTRSFNLRGLAFNAAGALAGTLAACVLLTWIRRRRRRRRPPATVPPADAED